MEAAAAILVQTIFSTNESLERIINQKEQGVSANPAKAAAFMPYYKAMLDMVKHVEGRSHTRP